MHSEESIKWPPSLSKRACEWCTSSQYMKEQFKHLSKSQWGSWPSDLLLDLQYCAECMLEYHLIRDDFLEDNTAKKKELWLGDVQRLSVVISQVLDSTNTTPCSTLEVLNKLENNLPSIPQYFSNDNLKQALDVPILEILHYPDLILDSYLSQQFEVALVTLIDNGSPPIVFQRLPGINILLIHPSKKLRKWAEKTVKRTKLTMEAEYQNERSIQKIITVSTMNLWENKDCHIFSEHQNHVTEMVILPPHLYSEPSVYWNGFLRLLLSMDQEVISLKLMRVPEHKQLPDTLVNTMEGDYGKEDAVFLAAFSCFIIILESCSSRMWPMMMHSPLNVIEIITNHRIYKKYMQTSSQDSFNGSQAAVVRDQSWFKTFVMSVLEFGDIALRCVSEVMKFLHKYSGTLDVKCKILRLVNKIVHSNRLSLLENTVSLWLPILLELARKIDDTNSEARFEDTNLARDTMKLLLKREGGDNENNFSNISQEKTRYLIKVMEENIKRCKVKEAASREQMRRSNCARKSMGPAIRQMIDLTPQSSINKETPKEIKKENAKTSQFISNRSMSPAVLPRTLLKAVIQLEDWLENEVNSPKTSKGSKKEKLAKSYRIERGSTPEPMKSDSDSEDDEYMLPRIKRKHTRKISSDSDSEKSCITSPIHKNRSFSDCNLSGYKALTFLDIKREDEDQITPPIAYNATSNEESNLDMNGFNHSASSDISKLPSLKAVCDSLTGQSKDSNVTVIKQEPNDEDLKNNYSSTCGIDVSSFSPEEGRCELVPTVKQENIHIVYTDHQGEQISDLLGKCTAGLDEYASSDVDDDGNVEHYPPLNDIGRDFFEDDCGNDQRTPERANTAVFEELEQEEESAFSLLQEIRCSDEEESDDDIVEIFSTQRSQSRLKDKVVVKVEIPEEIENVVATSPEPTPSNLTTTPQSHPTFPPSTRIFTTAKELFSAKPADVKRNFKFSQELLIKQILSWRVEWLSRNEQRDNVVYKFLESAERLPKSFDSMDDYCLSFGELMMLEAWEQALKDKENIKKGTTSPIITSIGHNRTFKLVSAVIHNVPQKDIENRVHPEEKGLVILRGEGSEVFGLVEKSEQERNSHRSSSNGDIPEYTLTLRIRTGPGLKASNGQTVEMEFVTSLLTTFRQWEALASFSGQNLLAKDILRPRGMKYFCSEERPTEVEGNEIYNKSQVCVIETVSEAIKQPLAIPKICLVQGPPGTGKSHTIVGMVTKILNHQYNDSNQSLPSQMLPSKPKILICCPSNEGVDEVIRKLTRAKPKKNNPTNNDARNANSINCGDFSLVRFGRESKIHESVKALNLQNMVQAAIGETGIRNVPSSSPIKRQLRELDKRIEQVQKEKYLLEAGEDQSKQLEDLEKNLQRQRYVLNRSYQNLIRRAEQLRDKKKRTQREILNGADIVCTTLSGSGSSTLLNELRGSNGMKIPFSCVIVDEACQCTEMDILIPLQYKSSKLILVGDPEQLPATVMSKDAKRLLYGRSMFDRLYRYFKELPRHERPVHLLDVQYRMHPEIAHFPSKYVYNDNIHTDSSVLKRCFPIKKHYALFNVHGGREDNDGRGSICNKKEATLISQLCQYLISKKLKPYDIGIITPYRAQLSELIKLLRYSGDAMKDIEVNTVDGFQGREKNVIIISCVRSAKNIGFLESVNRLNVALTRARHALFVFGNLDSLEGGKPTYLEKTPRGEGKNNTSNKLNSQLIHAKAGQSETRINVKSDIWKKLIHNGHQRRIIYDTDSIDDITRVVTLTEAPTRRSSTNSMIGSGGHSSESSSCSRIHNNCNNGNDSAPGIERRTHRHQMRHMPYTTKRPTTAVRGNSPVKTSSTSTSTAGCQYGYSSTRSGADPSSGSNRDVPQSSIIQSTRDKHTDATISNFAGLRQSRKPSLDDQRSNEVPSRVRDNNHRAPNARMILSRTFSHDEQRSDKVPSRVGDNNYRATNLGMVSSRAPSIDGVPSLVRENNQRGLNAGMVPSIVPCLDPDDERLNEVASRVRDHNQRPPIPGVISTDGYRLGRAGRLHALESSSPSASSLKGWQPYGGPRERRAAMGSSTVELIRTVQSVEPPAAHRQHKRTSLRETYDKYTKKKRRK